MEPSSGTSSPSNYRLGELYRETESLSEKGLEAIPEASNESSGVQQYSEQRDKMNEEEAKEHSVGSDAPSQLLGLLEQHPDLRAQVLLHQQQAKDHQQILQAFHKQLEEAQQDLQKNKKQAVADPRPPANQPNAELEANRQQQAENDYNKAMLDLIPDIVNELESMPPDFHLPYKSLGKVPHLTQQPLIEWPKDAAGLREYWNGVKTVDKPSDRSASILRMLVYFVEQQPRLKYLFSTIVQRSHNRDLPTYIEHVKSGGKSSFAVSSIQNPLFEQVPTAYVSSFNLIRTIKAKRDLIEVLINTFDYLCCYRALTNGVTFDETPPVLDNTEEVDRNPHDQAGAEEEDNEEEEEEEEEEKRQAKGDERGWYQSFHKASPRDAYITENKITKEGIATVLTAFLVSTGQDGTLTSKALNTMHITGLKKQRLDGMSTKHKQDCHYFPMFRCLYASVDGAKPPFHTGASLYKGCRLMKNSIHTLTHPKASQRFLATNIPEVDKIFDSHKALFVTNVALTFQFDDTQKQQEQEGLGEQRGFLLRTDSDLFKEEVIFEMIDRKGYHVDYLKTSKAKQIPRNSTLIYTNETSLNPGRILEVDFPAAQQIIDSFFEQDYFFNVDANLALYNLKHTDAINVKLAWKAVEGPKDILSAYLLASTIRNAARIAYSVEVKKLHNRAVHSKDTVAQFKISTCFPLDHDEV